MTRADPPRDEPGLDWIEPRSFLRGSAVLCWLGWPTFALAGLIAGRLPLVVAGAVVCAAGLAAWSIRPRDSLPAARVIAIHLSCAMAPILFALALMVGATLWPADWFAVALSAFGFALAAVLLGGWQIARTGRFPAMARFDEKRRVLSLARRPLPGLAPLVGGTLLVAGALWLLEQPGIARIVGAGCLAALMAMLAWGPLAEWAATAWLASRADGEPVRFG